MKAWSLLALVAVAAVGCQGQQKTPPQARTSPAVLDVAPPGAYQASAYSPPAYVAPPEAAPTAAPAVTQTPTVASSAVASTGGTYVVKKGDTLFHIAKEHYGDGKQWQRIAAANPGVTPNSLRVGQTLAMP